MRTYDIQLTANIDARRTIKGRYLRMMTATGTVRCRLDNGALFELPKGVGLRWPDGFSEVTLLSDTGQTVQVAVSDDQIDDSRLNLVGAVEVIDGGKVRTESGEAASGALYTIGASGQYCNIELMNPAGSGKNLVLKQFRVGAAGSMRVEVHNTETAYSVAGPAYSTVKKDVRTTLSLAAAKMYQGNQVAAQSGTPSFPAMMMGYVSGFSDFFWTFVEPVILGPGKGLLWAATSQNVSMSVSAEWFEEDI